MENTEREATRIIRELYPLLSDRELKEVEENLRRYFEIALEVCGHESPVSAAEVDSSPTAPTMKERSNESLKS
jgi:hypothetical protein